MRPPEDDLQPFMVLEYREDTEDQMTNLGTHLARDAQDACRVAAIGTVDGDDRIQRFPSGRYVALPVRGSADVRYTMKEELICRNGQEVGAE